MDKHHYRNPNVTVGWLVLLVLNREFPEDWLSRLKSSIVVLKTYTRILAQQSTLSYVMVSQSFRFITRENQLKPLIINTQLYYNI